MAKFDLTSQELIQGLDHTPPQTNWMDTPVDIQEGRWCYPGKPEIIEKLGLPHAHVWRPNEDDWNLPENWREIIRDGFRDRLERFRSLKVFMDICVRCGACADKCHYYIGSGDPKNMPVLRAELLRAIYRGEFTLAGRILGKLAGGRKIEEEDVIKEWFYYFYQCSECRRCSLYCPYGIDTAEVTMMARELLHLVGININWIAEPAANCNRTGNHLGIQPHAFADIVEFMVDDIEEITGVKVNAPLNEKGHEILFITPSGDAFADPGTFTFMGYLMLFHEIGLDYTMSTYASEGGNFGSFMNVEMMQKINGKMYEEARRLGCKWILGGECGHMWRVVNQYMDTMNGYNQHEGMVTPVSPITGTVFENAAATKMVHIAEFTADLLKHDKIKLDPSRNKGIKMTWHDSCNTARGMGLLEEPRFVAKAAVGEENFVEMPTATIREQTFCCAGGSGLNTEEFMDMRMRGGLPRGNALRHVRDNYDVNMMGCVCAIDRATLPPLANYWAPGVDVTGLHELVGNALIMTGEHKREYNLRGEELELDEPEVETSEAVEADSETPETSETAE